VISEAALDFGIFTYIGITERVRTIVRGAKRRLSELTEKYLQPEP